MQKEQISPFVRQVLRADLKGYDDKNEERIKLFTVDSRLFYVISGSGKITIGETIHNISTGNAVLFMAGTEYTLEPDNMECYIVNFDFTRTHSDIKQTFHPLNYEFFDRSKIIDNVEFDNEPLLNEPIVILENRLEGLLKNLFIEYTVGGDDCEALLSAYMSAVIFKILRQRKAITLSETKSEAISRKVISYINANYSRQIGISDIAKSVGYHPAHLNRLFKSCVGKTIHNYLAEYRLSVSTELLSTLNAGVAEIASMCGFSNYHYFSRCFKDRYGITPSSWRKQWEKENK